MQGNGAGSEKLSGIAVRSSVLKRCFQNLTNLLTVQKLKIRLEEVFDEQAAHKEGALHEEASEPKVHHATASRRCVQQEVWKDSTANSPTTYSASGCLKAFSRKDKHPLS